jgi:hypothetical protein
MVSDYLFLGPALIERLKQEVPELNEVLSAADLSLLDEYAIPTTPSAYVIYHGDTTPDDVASQGAMRGRQVIAQNWIVCLCVQNVNTSGLNDDANREAGPLISKILSGLLGFVPRIDNVIVTRPVGRSGLTMPVIYDADYAYYPIVFKTHFVW